MRHLSQIPTADRTEINAIPTENQYHKLKITSKNITYLQLPVESTMSTALRMPACATIQPERRNTITPKIFIMQDVKTPSHVPNRTGCEIKKFVLHHGLSP